MKDGTEYREFRAKPKGDPANPLSFDDLVRKFRSTAGSAIPHENVERLIDRIRTLETLPDVIEIMSLTGP
jgi:2-methylcitrate dehydratase PrpD